MLWKDLCLCDGVETPLVYLAIIITLSLAPLGASVDEEPLCPHGTVPLWGWALFMAPLSKCTFLWGKKD